MKTKYIHIGYPKNMSTTLQRDFFGKHPEILHLGIGVDTNIGYIDHSISAAIEVYLKYAKSFKYKEKKQQIKQSFDFWFEEAEERANIKVVGISAEHLSFSFTNDSIDPVLKLERVKDIFTSNTKIIMIIRSQFELIKSLYKESIRVGYTKTFNDYIDFIYKFQDRNFLYDFFYHNNHELYCEAFGKENVYVLPLEQYRNKNGTLIDQDGKDAILIELSNILGIECCIQRLDHFNQALTDSQLLMKRNLNLTNCHDLSNDLYNGAEFHRMQDYWIHDLKLNLKEEEIFKDVITKRKLIEQVSRENPDIQQSISFDADEYTVQKLKESFVESNHILMNKHKISLPAEYFTM